MSVAKCLSISAGGRAGKGSCLADGGADGGEWEQSHLPHQTAGSSHRRSRIAAFWRQGVLLCFLGFGLVLVFFKQIQASSPPAQPGSHFFMLCFPGCSLVHGDWSHCFQVSLQVIRKKEDLLGLRSLRKISLPSFPWTRFSGHNNTVSPRQVYPLKTLSLINNFFLI